MNKGSLTKAIKWVESKTTYTQFPREFEKALFGETQARKDCNKQQNNFIACFVDDGYQNHYNIIRIMSGKVKAFPGKSAKQRILVALWGLVETWHYENSLNPPEALHRYKTLGGFEYVPSFFYNADKNRRNNQ